MRSHVRPSRLAQTVIAVSLALIILAQPGRTQVNGSSPSYLKLQSTTPGTQQSGHANISGTLVSGNVSTGGVAVNSFGNFVDGVSSVADRYGVFGVNRGSLTIGGLGGPQYGVYADGGNSNIGLFAATGSTTLPAIDAEAYSSNEAIYARSQGAWGLHGVHDATTGLGSGPFSPPGVLGESSTGNGVLGIATASGLAGTAGYAPNGIGVYGLTYSGYGVYAASLGTGDAMRADSSTPGGIAVSGNSMSNSGTTIGVYGFASSNGYGVYSLGRFAATGTKSFQIDHPLDPENKVLNHYCSEGPEPLNVYQGHVTTGRDGFAWIALPDYFEAINRDPEYQLTVVDDSPDFVVAKVTRPEIGNRFQIRTSKPGIRVCWEVKAVRNDRYVQRNGAPVEAWKDERDRGKYLQPELYGKPKELGQYYRRSKKGPLKATPPGS